MQKLLRRNGALIKNSMLSAAYFLFVTSNRTTMRGEGRDTPQAGAWGVPVVGLNAQGQILTTEFTENLLT